MNKKIIFSIAFFSIAIIAAGILFTMNILDNEYHVHADFLVSINGEKINFSQSQYQSTATNTLHSGVHLHDGWGTVIHYHQKGITLQDFFTSLDMNMSQNCFTTQNTSYCTNQTHNFEVYVNNKTIENPQNYVADDLDQIAIIYQDSQLPVEPILSNVTDKACIQSAICPERGEPSEGSCVSGESCGVDISQFD